MRRAALAAPVGLALLSLAACAGFSDDGGVAAVERSARPFTGQPVAWARDEPSRARIDARVAALLAAPLGADAAVELALLNNRGLQVALDTLGIAEADRVQAGRLGNPRLTLARLRRGDEVEIERGFHIGLSQLVLMPLASRIATQQLEQTQRRVAMDIVDLAMRTRAAWTAAVAAAQVERYRMQVLDAAGAGAELARRMAQAGNFSKLQQAREQAFAADAALELARARHEAVASREALTRLLGLWGAQAGFALPERLPELPKAPDAIDAIESRALRERLDLHAARLQVAQVADSLGLVRATRWVNVVELGVMRNTSNEAPPQRGVELSLELPLFDWGDARVARAEAVYRQALNRAAQAAIEARSEVREAYHGYRTAWDVARHYRDEIVPLRQAISEENLLRYNGMLIGVFELLADARMQIASVIGAIDAQRGFWLARVALDRALAGTPGRGATSVGMGGGGGTSGADGAAPSGPAVAGEANGAGAAH